MFSIGSNGLTELTALDRRFTQYEKTLFGEGYKGMERSLETREVNDQLNDLLSGFLRLLSPFFLLKPAHKALEWLIRRFRINEFNVDSVFECILPYHETNLFVRMVQLLSFKNAEHWNFLVSVQRSRAQLPRKRLVDLLPANPKILLFLLGMVPKAIEAKTVSKTLISFYTSTLIDTFKAVQNVSQTLLSNILPFLLQGLKSFAQPDYQLASYMIVAQLAAQQALAPELTETLLFDTAKFAQHALQKESFLCILAVCQTQRPKTLSEGFVANLVKFKQLDTLIFQLGEDFELVTLLRPLIKRILDASGSKGDHRGLLGSLLKGPLALDNDVVEEVISHLLATFLTREDSDAARSKEILTIFQQRYPEVLDLVIEKTLRELSAAGTQKAKKDHERIYQFIGATFKGTRHQPVLGSGTTLYLSCIHADSQTRLLGVKQLYEETKAKNLQAVSFFFSLSPRPDSTSSFLPAVFDDIDGTLC